MRKIIALGFLLWMVTFCGGCNPIETGIANAVQTIVTDMIIGVLQGGVV